MTESILYGIDRSWTRYRANSDGDLFASDHRKLHLDRGDSTAKCSKRILLNSLPGDHGYTLTEAASMPEAVCRRCVPNRQNGDQS